MGSRDDAPDDDELTPLREGAIASHEAFTELLAAGFTERQALYLLGVTVVIRAGTGRA